MSVDVGMDSVGAETEKGDVVEQGQDKADGAGESHEAENMGNEGAEKEDEEKEEDVEEAGEQDKEEEDKEEEEEEGADADADVDAEKEGLSSKGEVGDRDDRSETRSSTEDEVRVLRSSPSILALKQRAPHLRAQLLGFLEELDDFQRSFPPEE